VVGGLKEAKQAKEAIEAALTLSADQEENQKAVR